MSAEEDKRLSHRCCEEVFTTADLAVGDEPCAAVEQEALEREIFGLALALVTESSKLAQLRQISETRITIRSTTTLSKKKGTKMTILHIEHPIRDFDTWKKAFESDPAGRERGGVRRYQILRPIDDPNYIMIDLDFDSSRAAEAFLAALREV